MSLRLQMLIADLSRIFCAGNPVKNGRCHQRNQRHDEHTVELGAHGLEAAAADRLYRRPSSHWNGSATELV